MTIPPTGVEAIEEIDVASLDPLFIERQRNRYASRAVAYLVWLNGLELSRSSLALRMRRFRPTT
jgi:hypothetical protein